MCSSDHVGFVRTQDYLDLLNMAANEQNPVDRMKYVVAFALSGLCRQVSFHKPFNPILGETYQVRMCSVRACMHGFIRHCVCQSKPPCAYA